MQRNVVLVPLLLLLVSAGPTLSAKLVGPASAVAAGDPEIPHYDDDTGKCTQITENSCLGLKYNSTIMPNHVGMNSQTEAAKRMNDYISLVKVQCSHYLKLFLCTIYFPMCTPVLDKSKALKPCRKLCIHVKSKCAPIMETFSFPWPSDLSCDKLPDQEDLCIRPADYSQDDGLALAIRPETIDNFNLMKKMKLDKDLISKQMTPNANNYKQMCSPAELKVSYEKNGTCLTRCRANLLFRPGDKRFAEVWITVWAVLCAVSTGLTILTFLTDSSRFRYPERPIVYLAACYFFYSVAYIIRAAVGAERIACRQLDKSGEGFLVRAGHEGTWCTIIFLILYFFGMAGALWWVMLTLTWFLSAARKWGYEGVESISSVLHMIAWAVPAIKTIIILIMHRIDADELTGLCSVGNQDRDSLIIFVIIPLAVYLAIGGVFLVFGFCSLFSVRQDLKQDSGVNGNIRRLEKLMAKIGVFSVLYTLPAICVVGSYLYEFIRLPQWQQTLFSFKMRGSRCLTSAGLDWDDAECTRHAYLPSVEVYMLKIFMSLVVGITSGMWVWCNKKTWDGWLRCFGRRFRRDTAGLKVLPQGHQHRHDAGFAAAAVSAFGAGPGFPQQGAPLMEGQGQQHQGRNAMQLAAIYQHQHSGYAAGKTSTEPKYMNRSCV